MLSFYREIKGNSYTSCHNSKYEVMVTVCFVGNQTIIRYPK